MGTGVKAGKHSAALHLSLNLELWFDRCQEQSSILYWKFCSGIFIFSLFWIKYWTPYFTSSINLINSLSFFLFFSQILTRAEIGIFDIFDN